MISSNATNTAISNNHLVCNNALSRHRCLLIVMVVAMYGFISYMHSYTVMKYYFVLFLACILCGWYTRERHYSLHKRNPWLWLSIYSLISSMLLNAPYSFYYLGMIFVALFLYEVDISEKMIGMIRNITIVVAFFSACSVFAQILVPNAFYTFTDIIHLPSVAGIIRKYGIYYGIICGVMGEASYTTMSIVIGFTFCVFSMKNRSRRMIKCIASICMFSAIILLGKRTLLLSVPVIIIATWLIYIYMRNKSNGILTIIIFLLTCAFAVPLIFGDAIELLLARGVRGYSGINLAGREYFWQIAIDMFKKKPIFGNGMNSYDLMYCMKTGKELAFVGAHNSYIQILAEYGMVGAIFYFLCIIRCMKFAYKQVMKCVSCGDINKCFETALPIFAILIIILIYALTGNPLYQPQEFFTFVIMLTMIKM